MIIADTNFLVNCIKKKIDFSNFNFVIPEEVVGELKKLGKKTRKLKDREAALIAFEIVTRNNMKQIKLNDRVDRGILKLAESKKGIKVATFDKVLKNKLKNKAEILDINELGKSV